MPATNICICNTRAQCSLALHCFWSRRMWSTRSGRRERGVPRLSSAMVQLVSFYYLSAINSLTLLRPLHACTMYVFFILIKAHIFDDPDMYNVYTPRSLWFRSIKYAPVLFLFILKLLSAKRDVVKLHLTHTHTPLSFFSHNALATFCHHIIMHMLLITLSKAHALNYVWFIIMVSCTFILENFRQTSQRTSVRHSANVREKLLIYALHWTLQSVADKKH